MSVTASYRGTNALVTGSTGFKGTWLCAWLERLGANVHGIALPPTVPMIAGWPGIQERFSCEDVDVRDRETVEESIRRAQPEIIFHLAAQPIVRESYHSPVETIAANVMGTVHVLEAARSCESVKAVVVVSSDKCYANNEWAWGYRESEPMGGSDPYSASKGCTEILTAAYRSSFSKTSTCDVATDWLVGSGRAGNVIGGGDWAPDRLIPDIIRGAMQDRPIEIRSPLAVRPWQHVIEPLAGYLMLGSRLLEGDESAACGWNFGPSNQDSMTVRELAAEVVEYFGQGQVVERPSKVNLKEANLLRLDSSQANQRLDWKALLSDQQRIQWTSAWYQAWQSDPGSVWRCTDDQIEDYHALIRQCAKSSSAWFGEVTGGIRRAA